MQLQVVNSPFNQEQVELLNRILPTLTDSQKVWLSGYLAGSQSAPVLEKRDELARQQCSGSVISKEVTVLYGSQTGNSQKLAEKAGKTLQERGFQVTISSMNDFKTNSLKKIQNLLIVVSTYGEGEAPDNAQSFYDFINSKRAPKLDQLSFSVLALGDSSYELFCQTGKEFDQRLEGLGGTRLYPRFDCDLDYEEPASEWLKGVIDSLQAQGGSAEQASKVTAEASSQDVKVVYSRTNPFKAEVLENLNLNGRGSNKETHHIELSLEGSGLTFEPGDNVGIYPTNDPELVELILQETKWNPEEAVTINKQGDVLSLKEALLSQFEITLLTKSLLKQAAQFSKNEALQELVAAGNEEKVKAYVDGRDLLDLIRDFGPWTENAQEFTAILRKLSPRLYSIASSFVANPDEVHLTIEAVRYEANERERKGVCSTFVSDRIQPGDTLPIYVQSNKHFKLPEKPEIPIIMVGPETGVAPFRAFMQEREEIGVEGKSWMFFGGQHFVTDFLYQTEWQKWLRDGVLTKMDVAFSDDTDEKVYVQHRLYEHSSELFEWLQEGAVVYICGDKKSMAQDVHNTLLDILEKEGSMSREQAEAYLADMKQQKRYQRDVY